LRCRHATASASRRHLYATASASRRHLRCTGCCTATLQLKCEGAGHDDEVDVEDAGDEGLDDAGDVARGDGAHDAGDDLEDAQADGREHPHTHQVGAVSSNSMHKQTGGDELDEGDHEEEPKCGLM